MRRKRDNNPIYVQTQNSALTAFAVNANVILPLMKKSSPRHAKI